jgi:hypothetical protein
LLESGLKPSFSRRNIEQQLGRDIGIRRCRSGRDIRSNGLVVTEAVKHRKGVGREAFGGRKCGVVRCDKQLL